jgi:coproporphyrinogen III oxidase
VSADQPAVSVGDANLFSIVAVAVSDTPVNPGFPARQANVVIFRARERVELTWVAVGDGSFDCTPAYLTATAQRCPEGERDAK